MKYPKKVLFPILITIVSVNVNAQDFLFENTASVARHQKKVSSVSFEIAENKNSYLVFTPRESSISKETKAALIYSIPDNCKESKIIMDEVFHHTAGSDALDLTIYNSEDSTQRSKAREVKTPKTSWDPAYDITAGYKSVAAKIQDLARAMNPTCLPARYRFVYVGSRRYKEIRYGEKAWSEE